MFGGLRSESQITKQRLEVRDERVEMTGLSNKWIVSTFVGVTNKLDAIIGRSDFKPSTHFTNIHFSFYQPQFVISLH